MLSNRNVTPLRDKVKATYMHTIISFSCLYSVYPSCSVFGDDVRPACSTSGADDGLLRAWALYWAATRPECSTYCSHDEVRSLFHTHSAYCFRANRGLQSLREKTGCMSVRVYSPGLCFV